MPKYCLPRKISQCEQIRMPKHDESKMVIAIISPLFGHMRTEVMSPTFCTLLPVIVSPSSKFHRHSAYRGRVAVVVELVCHPAPGVVRDLSIIRCVLKCKRRDIRSARCVGQRRNAHGEGGCCGVLDVGEGQCVAAAVAAGNVLCGSHYMA